MKINIDCKRCGWRRVQNVNSGDSVTGCVWPVTTATLEGGVGLLKSSKPWVVCMLINVHNIPYVYQLLFLGRAANIPCHIWIVIVWKTPCIGVDRYVAVVWWCAVGLNVFAYWHLEDSCDFMYTQVVSGIQSDWHEMAFFYIATLFGGSRAFDICVLVLSCVNASWLSKRICWSIMLSSCHWLFHLVNELIGIMLASCQSYTSYQHKYLFTLTFIESLESGDDWKMHKL